MTGKKRKMPKFLKVLLGSIFVIYLIMGLIIVISAKKNDEPFHGWLYYWDGPYKGKVVDAETGAPIEGAVVAGSWHLQVVYWWPRFCDAVETTTDRNGEFVLPRAWCVNLWLIGRLNLPGDVIVFKPGYLGYPPLGANQEERRTKMPAFTGDEFMDKKQYYIISLERPRFREERIHTLHEAEDILNFFDGYKKLPILLDLTNKENIELGFGERPSRTGGRRRNR
jgi:hypothetical protein